MSSCCLVVVLVKIPRKRKSNPNVLMNRMNSQKKNVPNENENCDETKRMHEEDIVK